MKSSDHIFSQVACRNRFHFFFQHALLEVTFHINCWETKSLSGLLAEAWPKYSPEHRAMNPHVKNPPESSPCDSWLGQRQREQAASSFPWEKCHLQILPIITAENQRLSYCQWLTKAANSPARLPPLRSAAVKMTLPPVEALRRVFPDKACQAHLPVFGFQPIPQQNGTSQLSVKKSVIPQI